jgi:hypothetical protein
VSAGLQLDANTVALWGFDGNAEISLTNYETVSDDGPNSLDYTDSVNRPLIMGGPGGVTIDSTGAITDADYARWFDGSNDRLQQTAQIGTTRASELTGTFTFQTRFWLDNTGTINTIVGIGGTGDGASAENILFRLRVSASAFLDLFWESGTGTNHQATQSTGDTIPVREWVDVAVICTENGADRDVEFFVNGVSQQTITGTTNAAGGENGHITIGVSDVLGDWFHGRIASMDWDLTARSPASILAQAVKTDSRFTGPTTNTWARFNFPEAPSVHDYGPHGLHLVPRVFSNAFKRYGCVGLPRSTRHSSHTQGGSNQGWFTKTTPEFVTALQDDAEWTLLMWHCPDGDEVGGDFFEVGDAGENESDNYLIHLDVQNGAGSRFVGVGWEEGIGNNVVGTGDAELWALTEDRDALLYGFVKSSNGDGTSDIDAYTKGTLADSIDNLTDPTGGDVFGSDIFVWGGPAGPGSFNYGLGGYVGTVHLRSVAMTQPQIQVVYDEGVALGGGTTFRTVPEVARSSP